MNAEALWETIRWLLLPGVGGLLVWINRVEGARQKTQDELVRFQLYVANTFVKNDAILRLEERIMDRFAIIEAKIDSADAGQRGPRPSPRLRRGAEDGR